MQPIQIVIFIQGLIALVPQLGPNGQANHMTALALDSKKILARLTTLPTKVILDEDAVCYREHFPVLAIRTSDSDCQAAGCQGPGSSCKCVLTGKQVIISPDTQPAAVTLNSNPANRVPQTDIEVGAFAYIANIDPSQYPLKNPTPAYDLTALMSFPFSSLTACKLVTRREGGIDNIHPLNYRPLHNDPSAEESGKALAQVLAASYDLAAGTSVTITLANLDGSDPYTLPLNLVAGKYIIIGFGNDRPHLHPGDPCEDGIARDFALFYELLQNPPVWKDRPIPQVSYSEKKDSSSIDEPVICQLTSGLTPMSRPVCPFMVSN